MIKKLKLEQFTTKLQKIEKLASIFLFFLIF